MDAKFVLNIPCEPDPAALAEIISKFDLPTDWEEWERSFVWWRGDHLCHSVEYHVGDMACTYSAAVEDDEILVAMSTVLAAVRSLDDEILVAMSTVLAAVRSLDDEILVAMSTVLAAVRSLQEIIEKKFT